MSVQITSGTPDNSSVRRKDKGEGSGDGLLLRFAQEMSQPGVVVTWLNHWSIQHANWEAMARMHLVGVDGTLLQLVLRRHGHVVGRTSADLVLPVVLDQVLAPDARVVLLGAAPGVARRAAERLAPREVLALDGFDELSSTRADPSILVDFNPSLVVVGLGAGLQEEVAAEIHAVLPHATVCTAGGWIDQFACSERYFPAWVHQLRVGWLWRIAHEPRRLLGRYTADALALVGRTRELVHRKVSLGGTFTELGLDRRAALAGGT